MAEKTLLRNYLQGEILDALRPLIEQDLSTHYGNSCISDLKLVERSDDEVKILVTTTTGTLYTFFYSFVFPQNEDNPNLRSCAQYKGSKKLMSFKSSSMR